jgi:Lrp/AsnC family transcriptional regulator, leucine-responsive regulatory protein
MASLQRDLNGSAFKSQVDETNRRILAELQSDARLSLAELGRRVGLSSPAVADRLQRLEADGVVRAYQADIDPRALGLALTVIIRIRPAPGQLPNVADLARATDEVVECHRVTGDDCFFMKAHVRDVTHLEDVIDRFVVLGQTTTSIVQSSPVPRRGIAVGPRSASVRVH